MSVVDHLDELRSRIMISVIALVFTTTIALVFNNQILEFASRPLPLVDGEKVKLITLDPTEAFFTTLKVAFYTGILAALPILIYQAYSFFLPALSPKERKAILPFVYAAPVLFICGVAFAYYVVFPAAIGFLLSFNSDIFENQVRANSYFGFFASTLFAVGMLFELPIGIMTVTRLGIVTPAQIAHNRRYAILIIAVLAMLLPGTDPVTMLISMAPIYILFELSLIVSRVMIRQKQKDQEAASTEIDVPPGGAGASA